MCLCFISSGELAYELSHAYNVCTGVTRCAQGEHFVANPLSAEGLTLTAHVDAGSDRRHGLVGDLRRAEIERDQAVGVSTQEKLRC